MREVPRNVPVIDLSHATILPCTFAKAIKAGVKVAFARDVGGIPWTENRAKEFTYMVRRGMTPMQAIKSATVVGAELLNMKGRMGEISLGAFADVIAVAGDPFQDISILEHVVFAMKAGQVYKR